LIILAFYVLFKNSSRAEVVAQGVEDLFCRHETMSSKHCLTKEKEKRKKEKEIFPNPKVTEIFLQCFLLDVLLL
jgi:hypothetical protein